MKHTSVIDVGAAGSLTAMKIECLDESCGWGTITPDKQSAYRLLAGHIVEEHSEEVEDNE